METILSVLIGIGLSAACGFRVFLPPLIMSIAAMSGHLTLARGFEWIGSGEALCVFTVASILEISAYYVPWLDNLLDTIATPTAIVAGILVTASMIQDMSPMLKWTLACIAGGSAAGLVQAATITARAASTALTGGGSNHLVSTSELGAAIFTSLSALWLPMIAIVLIFVLLGIVSWRLSRQKLPPKIQVS